MDIDNGENSGFYRIDLLGASADVVMMLQSACIFMLQQPTTLPPQVT
jgi:hypothetical protein